MLLNRLHIKFIIRVFKKDEVKTCELKRHIRTPRKWIECENEAMIELFEEEKYMAGSWISA